MPGKFKANDEVQLKAGSHTLIVVGHAITHVSEGNVPIKDKYECSWFDGLKFQKAIFKEEDIKLIKKHNIGSITSSLYNKKNKHT
jgi:uncharacterized protein YodC (DUF2158 family)